MVKSMPCVMLMALLGLDIAHAQHSFDGTPPVSDRTEQGGQIETGDGPKSPSSIPNWINGVAILVIFYLGSPLSRRYTRTIPIPRRHH